MSHRDLPTYYSDEVTQNRGSLDEGRRLFENSARRWSWAVRCPVRPSHKKKALSEPKIEDLPRERNNRNSLNCAPRSRMLYKNRDIREKEAAKTPQSGLFMAL